MTKPALAVSLDKPFRSGSTWWAYAHVPPQYLIAGIGETEALAQKSLAQEIKELEKVLKEREVQSAS